jgi:hypothetical protein
MSSKPGNCPNPVKLKWLKKSQGRLKGEIEYRDYSAERLIVDGWIKDGYCERVHEREPKPSAPPRVQAVEAPPKTRAVRRGSKRTIEG